MRVNILYLSIFLIPVLLSAQWSTTPETNLLIGNGYESHIISDGEGGAFIAWIGGFNIHIQKVDKFGYIQWGDEIAGGGVNAGGCSTDTCYRLIMDIEPVLVVDDSGGVYVFFEEICCIEDCGGMWPVEVKKALVQHIDTNGNRLWEEAGIEPMLYPTSWTSPQAIVSDGSGGTFVVFHHGDDWNTGGVDEYYVQHLDYNSNFLWGDTGIYLTNTSHLGTPVSDGQGGLLIGWSGIVHRFSYDGDRLWGDDGVYVPTGSGNMVTDSSEIIYITGGEYLGNSEKTIVVQKLAFSDGSLLWDSTGVTIDTSHSQSQIRDLDLDVNGNCWVLWNGYGEGESYLQSINPSGIRLFGVVAIPVSQYESDHNNPVFTKSIENSFFIFWGDNRNGNWNSYGQRINISGDYIWQFDVQITTSGGRCVTTDVRGGGILSWYQSSDFGIYVQQVSVYGNLGEVILGIDGSNSTGIPRQFHLNQNYPNPFNSITTITYFLEKPGLINLSLFNINGNLIKIQESGYKQAGNHTYTFIADELASGIYFYCLEGKDFKQTKKLIYLK